MNDANSTSLDRFTYFRTLACVTVLGLSGCATLENGADHVRDFAHQHPVVTGVAVAVIVGGTVAALDHHHKHEPAPIGPERPICRGGAC